MADSNRKSQGSGVQWMVMLANGRIMGPYSTDAVLKMISENALTGDERIRPASGGAWIPISSDPTFYDQLLEALHQTKKPAPQTIEKMSQETVVAPLPVDAFLPPTDPQQQPVPEDQGNHEETQILANRKPKRKEKKKTRPAQPVVDLQNLGTLEKKEGARLFGVPFAIFIAAAAVFAVAYYLGNEKDDHRVRLIYPRFGHTATLADDDLKRELEKITRLFIADTFEGYSETQARLVSTLEKAPQSLQGRGLLCLTYRELWPYTRQDSSDVEAIQSLVKSTKALDPIGTSGVYCELSKLLMFGKVTEARGILDYMLNQSQYSQDAVLIALKAEVLAAEQDPKTAILFIENVRQLWASWLKGASLQAEFYMQTGQTQQAATIYEQILKTNPKHKTAQVKYGILNYRFFKQNDKALSFLLAALTSKGRMPRQLESKANFTVGQIYYDAKKMEKAKEFAQKAYELNPGDSEYKNFLLTVGGSTKLSSRAYVENELVFLGDQYFRSGDFLSAQAEYKAAFELDPTNALAATKAAKCLWELSQATEALNWLNKAVKADPKLIEPYLLLADYNSQRFNYAMALQILNRASTLFPNNNEVLRGYGQLEFRRNNMKDALQFLKRAEKIYANDIETILLLARTSAALEDYQQAQNYAIRAMELDSTNNEAIVIYAKNLVQFRGLDAGLYFIREQISKFSYTIEFRLALAEMYKEVERYRDSLTVYEQIVEADPKNKRAQLGLGESYQNLSQYEKALQAYLTAAVLDPSDAEPVFRAGLLYIDMNRYPQAIKQFERALKINPLYPRGNYYIGKAAFMNSDFQTALQACEAERKINPNLADSYLLAAEIHSARKDFAKCASEYQSAVRLRPQGAGIYVKMARCYRQSGSPEIGEAMLNIALNQESGLPDIYKEQGAIYESKGDVRAAVKSYNKYLALSPNAPDKAEIEARINSLGN